MPFHDNVIQCDSQRPDRQIMFNDVLSDLFRSPTIEVTLTTSSANITQVPYFHDLSVRRTRSWDEFLLQNSLVQIAKYSVQSLATKVGVSANRLSGLLTVSCRPDVLSKLTEPQSMLTWNKDAELKCILPQSAYCSPGIGLYSLADQNYQITGVEYDNDDLRLTALVCCLAALGLVVYGRIIHRSFILSMAAFCFLSNTFWLWGVDADWKVLPGGLLLALILRSLFPTIFRSQLSLLLAAAGLNLMTRASSFAYGSAMLLGVYLLFWVVYTAARLADKDEKEEAKELDETLQRESEQLKQEGLHDIVDAVLEDDSYMKKLSDEALRQIVRMGQQRSRHGGSLDDMSPEQRQNAEIYEEGRAAAKRLRVARVVPIATAVLLATFWHLNLGELMFTNPLFSLGIVGSLLFGVLRTL